LGTDTRNESQGAIEAYTVEVTLFATPDVCARLQQAASSIELDGRRTAIDWVLEPELEQAVGELSVRCRRAEARGLAEQLAAHVRAVAGFPCVVAVVFHSIGRFGGHFAFSFVPPGVCQGCGRAVGRLGEDGYHYGCRPASRDEAKAFADARVLGLRA
jgi:hypothetical protein